MYACVHTRILTCMRMHTVQAGGREKSVVSYHATADELIGLVAGISLSPALHSQPALTGAGRSSSIVLPLLLERENLIFLVA